MIAAVLAALLMVAFAWGRWTGESGPASQTAQGHARGVHPPASRFAPPAERFAGYPGPVASRPASIAPALAALLTTPPAPAPSRPGPELVSRVAEEATRVLENARPELAARCVPAEGIAGGEGAKLTFNVTFDASGREIARGISEDRRARATGATAVASCLRKLPIGTLRVAPPGTNVAVRVAMSFP